MSTKPPSGATAFDRRKFQAAEASHLGRAHAASQLPALCWTTDLQLRLVEVFGAIASEAENHDSSGRAAGEFFDDSALAMTHHRLAVTGDGSHFSCSIAGRPFEAQVRPLRDDHGRIVGVAGCAMDLSGRAATDAGRAAHERMEALGRTVGAMAHDFNNVLTIIESYSQFLMERFEPTQDSHEDASIVHGAARRAGDLIQKLLVFAGREPAQLEWLDFSDFIEEVAETLEEHIRRGLVLERDMAHACVRVRADSVQLTRALRELVDNACDATGDTGRITLRTRTRTLIDPAGAASLGIALGDWAVITVEDEGRGMEPAIRDHAFEPFYATEGRNRATGLGLPMVYGTVRQGGGGVSIESTLGGGTQVHIYLPVLDERPVPSRTPQANNNGGEPRQDERR